MCTRPWHLFFGMAKPARLLHTHAHTHAPATGTGWLKPRDVCTCHPSPCAAAGGLFLHFYAESHALRCGLSRCASQTHRAP